MPGQRGLHGDLGRFLVADLTDENRVRVLAENGAQPVCKRDARQPVDLNLVDALEGVLDRVLDRHDVLLVTVELVARRVERGRLTASGRPGDKDHAEGRRDESAERLTRGG